MKIAICAGKTGGHTYPALAIARSLRVKNTLHDPFFIGTRTGVDENLLNVDGFQFFGISGSGLPAGLHWKTLKWGINQVKGLAEVYHLFRRQKPKVVLSFGGFISSAPVLVAKLMGIPSIIHEANVLPGRANRFLAWWANAVCTSFPIEWHKSTERSVLKPRRSVLKRRRSIKVTGLPIREKFLKVDRKKAFEHFGLDPHKKVVFAMGGSLGSRKINDGVLEMLHHAKDLSTKIQIIHVTGKNDYSRVMEQYQQNGLTYKPYAFLDDVEYAFHAADLFLGRAGASTLAELTCCGLPAVLVPYPHAMEDHQRANAQYLEQAGAAHVLEDSECRGETLTTAIQKILFHEETWLSMAQCSKKLGVLDAAARIIHVLEEVVHGVS